MENTCKICNVKIVQVTCEICKQSICNTCSYEILNRNDLFLPGLNLFFSRFSVLESARFICYTCRINENNGSCTIL